MPTSTPSPDELQKQHESRLRTLIDELAGGGVESDRALVRALIHRGVHLAAESRSAEFCGLATFLAEMIGHVHGLMHGADPHSARHAESVH